MCKRSLLFFGIFLLSVIISPLCFVGVDAAAAEPVYKQLTPTEAYTFYGDSIQAVYYSQSGYKTVTLTASQSRYSYYLSGSITGENVPSWLNNTNLRYVWYGAAISDYSLNPSYLGIDISPNVHFSDCTALRFAACGYLGGSHVSSASYEASFINLYAGGQLRYENGLYTDSNNYYPEIHLSRGGGSWTNSLVWADYQSDTVMNVSMMRVGLNGSRVDGGYLGVYLLCPLVNDTAVTGSGVITGSSDTTAPSGSTVDMTETNSLLDRIKSGISGLGDSLTHLGTHILDGIKSIFVPEEGYFDDKVAALKNKFSWYSSISSAWSEFYTSFSNISDESVPSISMTLDNRTYFGGRIGSSSGSLLVLDWFVQYRSVIRALISAFMWIFFLWRVYCHIPNIISGSGMEVQKTDDGAAWTIHGHKL